ncbi:MAG: hypothetical protein J5654_05745 [Victivallales bacterium]|nr:hypothetical protein [Victivallales bacterium]
MLHFLGMVMALAFLVQLRLHGGAMFALQWWPILITGVLFASAFCLEPQLPSELFTDEVCSKQHVFLRKRPSDLALKTAALISFGLSPIWVWRNSAASLSYGLMRYFALLQGVSLVAMFAMVLLFALHLRVLCVCFGGTPQFVRRWSFAARGLLYFVLVPVFSVMLGGTRFWSELFHMSELNWRVISQMLEFQFMLPFHSWIGTVITWLSLTMLAGQVFLSFQLLLLFNRFMDAKELNEQAGRFPDAVDESATDDSNAETTEDD